MKKFDREEIFAEVDASNKRFETYTDEQRKQFAEDARLAREREEESIRQMNNSVIIAACCCMM